METLEITSREAISESWNQCITYRRKCTLRGPTEVEQFFRSQGGLSDVIEKKVALMFIYIHNSTHLVFL